MSAPIQQLMLTAAHPVPGTEAAAFIARTSGLNTLHIDAYVNLINGLVADSLWSKFDALYIFATQDSTTAALNLISSTFNSTVNGSPTFTADRGFAGTLNSTTKYIDTNFNPTTATSPQFVRNSAHISTWSVTTPANTTDNPIGSYNAAGPNHTYMLPGYTDSFTYFRINNSTATGADSANIVQAAGHFMATRTSSSAILGYKNGSQVLSNASSASAAPANQNLFTLGVNNNGPAAGAAYQLAMSSIGAAISSTDATNFYNRLRTYMTAVGVP